MQTYYTYIALQLARERALEADAWRRRELAKSVRPERPSAARRAVGGVTSIAATVIDRIARRLERTISDDLRRPRASTE